MKERPILFSAPMVRAILEGRKTQTRRIVKPRVIPVVEECFRVNGKWCNRTFDYDLVNLCPYGQPGDRLWVRETWASRGVNPVAMPSGKFGAAVVEYRADTARATWDRDPIQRDPDGHWRPSIFMPRWASRIRLEVTGVRVERLNDISEADAIAEGIPAASLHDLDCDTIAPSAHYRDIWESINGPGSWAKNPFVWVVEFKRIGGEK